MPVCKDGDVSTTVSGLSTVVHCTCPDDMVMKEFSAQDEDSSEEEIVIKPKDFICKKVRLGSKSGVKLKGFYCKVNPRKNLSGKPSPHSRFL